MKPFDKISEILEKRAREQLTPIADKMDLVVNELKKTNELLEKILEELKNARQKGV